MAKCELCDKELMVAYGHLDRYYYCMNEKCEKYGERVFVKEGQNEHDTKKST